MNSNISPIKENMNLFGNDDTDTETDSEDAEEKVRIYIQLFIILPECLTCSFSIVFQRRE